MKVIKWSVTGWYKILNFGFPPQKSYITFSLDKRKDRKDKNSCFQMLKAYSDKEKLALLGVATKVKTRGGGEPTF